jgi:hypothetical protein
MAVETITVADVNKSNGKWYNVELVGDDRSVATNDKKIADALLEADGEVTVEMGHKRNGEYDNYYVNKILDPNSPVAELAPTEDAPKRKPTVKRKDADAPNPNQEAKQRMIQAQWAFGQAIQLFSGNEAIALPLSENDLKDIATTAHAILTGATALATR